VTPPRRLIPATPRFVPLAGVLVGLMAAATYWLGAQVWPTNLAVALAMAAMFWATAGLTPAPAQPAKGPVPIGPVFWVFVLLIKYNALMALSAAAGPFPLPPHLTLGLIMIAGQAAGSGLVMSLMAGGPDARPQATAPGLAVALLVAFAPATLLGIPGLAGLVAAIVMRLLLAGRLLPRLALGPQQQWEVTRQLTEVCFYLGAVATWRYV
jgi:cobalamin synthase